MEKIEIENTNKDLVSIIMPAFNASSTIDKSIESVINQNYKNWELIIVDDNSKDKTKKIIEFFSKKDERIKPIFSKKMEDLLRAEILH